MITINQGSLFMLTDERIERALELFSELGPVAADTRLVSLVAAGGAQVGVGDGHLAHGCLTHRCRPVAV